MIRHFFFIVLASLLVALLTTLCLSPRIWYENSISIVASLFQKPQLYTDNTSERLNYNKALSLAQNGQLETAKNLLASIDTLKKNSFIQNVLELQGDIAYHQKSSTGQVIAYYNRSLEIASNSRIDYKKSLLLNENNTRQNSQNQDSSLSGNTQSETIQNMQKNRSQYLNTNTNETAYQKEQLDRIKQALNTNNYTPIKDW